MNKKNLIIFFGGESVEHDVSIITGAQAVQNADPQKYNIVPVYLSQNGEFHVAEKNPDMEEFFRKIFTLKKPATINVSTGELIIEKSLNFINKKIKIDVAFPTFHGTYGEDGSFQGLLEMAHIPYVGSGVAASAVGMNKDLFKKVMDFHKIPILSWQTINKWDYDKNFQPKFAYPLIIKPTNLGSSIGVSKVNNSEELDKALEIIFHLDYEALIEPYLDNMIEINCSVLGSRAKQDVSVCEQPMSAKEILSFEDKYLTGGKKTKIRGMASQDRRIPAPLSQEQTQLIQNLAKDVFRYCECSGVSRIDFMIDKNTNKIYVNEINTIPGSLSFYLWEASGISFQELIDKLVNIAIEEDNEKNKIQKVFKSPLAEKYLKTNSNKDQATHSESTPHH